MCDTHIKGTEQIDFTLRRNLLMARIALGIDLGGTDIKAGTVDHNGQTVGQWKTPTEAQGGATVILQNMFDLTEKILGDSKSAGHEVLGIGIGSPGVIDHKNGVVVKMVDNLPGWSGMPLAAKFEEQFGLTTKLDNDANVCALAECLFGAGKGKNDIVCYTLGTGVGGGIIINRKVHHGAHGYAGEVGHASVVLDGLSCSCGNVGCVEQYGSARAIGRDARKRLEAGEKSVMSEMVDSTDDVTSKTVYEAALKNDALALEVIDFAARRLGSGIASTILILDPEMIVIGGGGSNMGDVLLDPVREEVKRRLYFSDAVEIPIVQAELGEDAGFIGAAGLIHSEI